MATGNPPPGFRIATFRVPEELHRAAGFYAALRGETSSDVIRRGLVNELTHVRTARKTKG